jgi:hypothetical protein
MSITNDESTKIAEILAALKKAIDNGGRVSIGIPRTQFWTFLISLLTSVSIFGASMWLQLDRVITEQQQQSTTLEDISNATKENTNQISALREWRAYEAGQRGTGLPPQQRRKPAEGKP